MRDTPSLWIEQCIKHHEKGQRKQYPLQVAAQLNASANAVRRAIWPTPVTFDVRPPNEPNVIEAKANRETRYGLELRDAVMLWPTPRANMTQDDSANATMIDGRMVRPSGTGFSIPLPVAAKQWPTPTRSDHATRQPSENWNGNVLPSKVGIVEQKPLAKLNPSWVETLMGFPVGWTDGLPAPEKRSKNGNPRERAKEDTIEPQG